MNHLTFLEFLLYFIFNNWRWVVSHRWVFHFAHLRQLPVLVPYIPIENPRLRDTAYEVCKLQQFL